MPSSNVVQVIVQGVDKASGVIKGIGGSFKGLFTLANGVKALVPLSAIYKLNEYADSLTQIQSRIRLVTESSRELSAVGNELFAVAQRNNTDFASLADLYARVARNADGLGASQRDIIKFTEAVSRAIQVSGAAAQEASYGVIQLGQALASGTLRGDELRSVLEQMPRLAQAIVKGMDLKGGIGELRALAAEGRLVSDKVFKAILSQAPELANEFSKMSLTSSAAFTKLGNSLTRTGGEFWSAIGGSDALKAALVGLSKFLDDHLLDFVAVGSALQFSLIAAWETGKLVFAKLGALFDAGLKLFQKTIKEHPLILDFRMTMFGPRITAMPFIKDVQNSLAEISESFDESNLEFADNVSAARARIDAAFEGILERLTTGKDAISDAAKDGLQDIVIDPKIIERNNKLLQIFPDLKKKVDEFTRTEREGIEATTASMRAHVDALKNTASGFRISQEEAEKYYALIAELHDKSVAALEQKEYGNQYDQLKKDLLSYTETEQEALDRTTAQMKAHVNELLAAVGVWKITEEEAARYFALIDKRHKEQSADLEQKNVGDKFDQMKESLLSYTETEQEAISRQTEMMKDYVRQLKEAPEGHRISAQAATDMLTIIAEKHAENMKKLGSEADVMKELGLQAARSMQSAFSKFLFDPFEGGVKGMVRAFGNAIRQMLADAASAAILKTIFKKIPQLSFLSEGMKGFATGGSFVVGGAGGTDTKTVMFRASPGERVDIKTPAQQREERNPPKAKEFARGFASGGSFFVGAPSDPTKGSSDKQMPSMPSLKGFATGGSFVVGDKNGINGGAKIFQASPSKPDQKSLGQFVRGFATGGSFFVKGTGGTDTKNIMFRATPGERIDVSTPAQQRAARGGNGTTIVQQFHVQAGLPPQWEVQLLGATRMAAAAAYDAVSERMGNKR